jgi:aryl-alcohol dehydrogenase-like predicted oxidoreductase
MKPTSGYPSPTFGSASSPELNGQPMEYQRLGTTVAMAWVLKNPVVTAPIVGATKAHHLADVAAAVDLKLTDEEISSLEEPYTPREPTYF